MTTTLARTTAACRWLPPLLRPTARSIDWLAWLGAAAVADVIVVAAVVGRPAVPSLGHVVTLRMTMVVLAAGAGLMLGDPAEVTLDATPAGRRRRWALRLGIIAAAWALSWTAVVAITATAGGPFPALQLTAEALGWLAVGWAAARLGGTATLAVTLLAAGVSAPWLPARFAVVATDAAAWSAAHGRWAATGVAALAAVASTLRDPQR